MIRAILIDDEEGAIKSIQSMLKKYCPNVHIIGLADNIEKGQELIEELKPELLFLDINMPNGTGLELMERIAHIEIGVIFTTAYQEYAINAIRLSAVDYLLKPIDSKELKEAVDRFVNMNKSYHEKISLLKELINSPEKIERLAISDNEGVHFIKRADITYIEASRNYSLFHLKDSGYIVSSKTLGEYERILVDHGFARVHRSFLVNMEHVLKFDKREGCLVLPNDHKVEVSRNNKEKVLAELNRSA